MKWVVIFSILFTFGCTPKDEFKTDLREYSINDIHVVVGVGQWKEDKFVIQSYDGNEWVANKDVAVYESPVSLESFKRVTK